MSNVRKLKVWRKQHKTKEMYDKVKELTKKCTLKGGGYITDKNGKILFEQEEIDKRWVEYIKELYDDDRVHQCHNLRSHQDKAF